jgi:hypothetical protein
MFPVFKAGEVHECVTALDPGTTSWPLRHCEQELESYQRGASARQYLILRLAPPLGVVILASTLVLSRDLYDAAARSPQNLTYVLLFAGRVVLSLLACALILGRASWEQRFYLAVNKARKAVRSGLDRNERTVISMNVAGKAARFLFRYLQRRRVTWVSPPAVADRALAIAFPLVNVSLGGAGSADEDTLETYDEFLYYAAGLVAVGREDLVPVLRDRYSSAELPPRVAQGDEIPERDAQFLDPMRNYNRWAVAKDFLYPLAAWLSLVVAVVALVVSLTR